MKGVVANRRRDHRTAIDALRRAVAIEPSAALAWLALGNAYARSEQIPAAAHAYREVLAREPSWADAHFNLGLLLKRQGDLEAAATTLHAAWVHDPMNFESAKQCIATLAQRVREGQRASLPDVELSPSSPRSVTVVLCSIDSEKQARAEALYRRTFADFPHEIIAVRNPRSLAEAYNGAIARATGEVIVLSHDDIDIVAPDFAARLIARLEHNDVLGVVGSTRIDGPSIGWSGHPHLRGWITHRVPNSPGWSVDVLHPSPVASDISMLDGVFLAARREVFEKVRFDAETFDGFHLYDLDWSYRAASAGCRLGVAGDLLLVHFSRGQYGEQWQRYGDRFCARHGISATAPKPSSFFGATLDTVEQVRSFYALLAKLET